MSIIRSSTISQRFRNLAYWTWRKLESANRSVVSFGEETITESLLLKLSEWSTPKNIRIKAYTKAEEGTGTKATGGLPTGADWSFWIANKTSGTGIELRIQAKRQFGSGMYQSLDGAGPQLKDLWNNKGSAIPLYVFYNGPFQFSPRGSRWASFKCPNTCSPSFKGQSAWGCSFAPVSGVRGKNKPYPSQILGIRPWHCLVCNCPLTGPACASLPDTVAAALRVAYLRARDGSDNFEGNDLPNFEPHDSPPEWVSLMNDDSPESPAWREFWQKTDLKGVALIQQISAGDDFVSA